MLVFISPRFVISDFCLKEVNLADLLRLPIIPVMIEKTPWPPPGQKLLYNLDFVKKGGICFGWSEFLYFLKFLRDIHHSTQ